MIESRHCLAGEVDFIREREHRSGDWVNDQKANEPSNQDIPRKPTGDRGTQVLLSKPLVSP